jgi:tetratricopeptide (TPR) repeat protein
LQQDCQLLNGANGQRLERFNEAQTRDYLQQVGLVEPSQVNAIYQKTRGLPYYLNRIRETHLKGQTVDLTQDISQLFFPNLNSAQTHMLQHIACCRWFDKSLVRHLAEAQGLGFQLSDGSSSEGCADWFEWLKQRDFLDPTLKPYGLDDVARSTLRESMHQDDCEAFYQIHGSLAAYFEERANQVVAADQSELEKYSDGDWCRYTIEAIYHTFFSRRKDYPAQFLSHLFASCYLNQIGVVIEPVQSIAAEAGIERHPLLPGQTQKFLNSLELVVLKGGWNVLDTMPDEYEVNAEQVGFDKFQVETALQTCLNSLDSLQGLAKFAALLYRSKHCPESQRLEWLVKAKTQAEQISSQFDPDFSSGLFLWDIGNALSALGRKEEAITSYDQAIHFKPDYHQAWYNRGNALAALGRKKEAATSYDQAIHFKPDYHDAWNNRGNTLADLGRNEEAITSYDQAIHFKPDLHEAWFNRGIALDDLGRREEAITSYDQAIHFKPGYHEAWNNRGNTLSALGRKEEAVTSYDQAIHFKPDLHEAWNNRGNALSALGRKEEAVTSYDQAIHFKPGYHEAWYNRGNALSALGRKEEAVTSYNQAIHFKPDYHQAWVNRGIALSALGRHEEAITNYDQAIHFKPDYHQAWGRRGMVLAALGRYEEAVDNYDRVLQINPDDTFAVYKKAACYGLQGDNQKATETLQEAINLDSDYQKRAKTDSDFDRIRDDDRFRALVGE